MVAEKPGTFGDVHAAEERIEKSVNKTLALIGLILVLPLMLYEGWVTVLLYEWFLKPIHSAMPVISTMQMSGLYVLKEMIATTPDLKDKTGKDSFELLITSALLSSMYLLIGWILSLTM